MVEAAGEAQRHRRGTTRRSPASPRRSAPEPRASRAMTGGCTSTSSPGASARRRRDEGDRPAVARRRSASPGVQLYHAAGAGHQCRRPAVAHPVSIHAAGCRSRRAEQLGAEDAATGCRRCRMLRDVATDQQIAGTTATLTIDRDAAAALRHPAAADRRHAVRRVRPARGDAVFHPAQLLLRHPGSAAAAGGRRSARCASFM